MLAFLLGIALVATPADSTDDLDACLKQAPIQSDPPITWGEGIRQMWSSNPPVAADTIRAHLSQIRAARQCLRALDPSTVERPYLGNIMRIYNDETALLASLRRFSEAFRVFRDARSYLASKPQIPSTEAGRTWWPHILHRNQALLQHFLGDLSSAIDHYLKALQNTPGGNVSQRVTYLMDVGIVHQNMQDYRSARYYFNRATRLFRNSEHTGESHSSQWARLTFLKADFLLEKTLNTKFATAPLERAQDFARRSRAAAEPNSEQHAKATQALSEVLGYLGHYERAYRLNKESRSYARSNDDDQFYAFSLLKLGVLHIQTGRWDEAESVLKTALSKADVLEDLDYQRRIFRALGRLHELQTDWSMAEEYYREGVSVIEQYRESLTATQWSSTAFAQWRDVHRGLVRALLAQNRPREALTALDRSRARHLQDLRTQARVAKELPTPMRARLDSVSRALSDVRTRLGKNTLSAAEETDLRTREATLMTARQEILGPASTTSDRPSIDQVAASLGQQDRALVSYFLDDPWPVYNRSPRSAAFLLTADTLRTVSLPELTQDSVRTHVEAISPLFSQTDRPQRMNAMHFDLRPLRTLHDHLYAPVAGYLPDEKPLTVIPDGPMFRMPYSMLATALPGGRYDHAQARFVLHKRATTLNLATSMAADTSMNSGDPATFSPNLAAFGVSTFDTLRTVPSDLRTTPSGPDGDSSLALSPLPGVQTEMSALNRLFSDAETFLDKAATESAFTKASRHAGVIHLASHAFVHPSSPLQNAFLLHPDSTSDGLLFLHELQARDRPIPLAVLSGCSTARGTLRGGEGMAGLQYAFLAMGAQSTVSNLWPTADQPSVTLMETFYTNLQAGLPKDRALRQAKLTYLENHPNKASPFFWASSVLYGSPRPVPLESSNGFFSWLWSPFGAGLLLVLTSGGLWGLSHYEFS